MKNNNSKISLIVITNGKVTVAKKIAEIYKKAVIFIEMDNYYQDLSFLTWEERKEINFDHSNAFDYSLLIHNLEQLLLRNTIEQSIYDFKDSSRSKKWKLSNLVMLLFLMIFLL